MELHEKSHQNGTDELRPDEAAPILSSDARRWYDSERLSHRRWQSAAIPLLIILCIVLYFEPTGNKSDDSDGDYCAEPRSVQKLKPSSTGKRHRPCACFKLRLFRRSRTHILLFKKWKIWSMVQWRQTIQYAPRLALRS